jgi:large subunit ribosomal protein L7Ae
VLLKRLKVPPAVNQFKNALSKGDAKVLFTLLDKYRPETKAQKTARLREKAAAGPGAKESGSKPKVVKYGLNHVTSLIEKRQAKLVIIAHDVDPLELVLWLPTLCRKKDIPYVIVKSKARLGRVVHKKTASTLVITDVQQQDQPDLALLVTKARDLFNSRYPQMMKTSGGKQMGFKHHTALQIAAKNKKKEQAGKTK